MEDFDSNAQLELKKQLILIVTMAISVMVCIFIIIWSQEPNYRPLLQDMRVVDAVKIVDAMEQANLIYRADLRNHMLYVEVGQADEARLILARLGLVVEFPAPNAFSSLPEACLLLDQETERPSVAVPVYEKAWFWRLVKFVAGALIVMVLILAVVRPMLREFIQEPNDD